MVGLSKIASMLLYSPHFVTAIVAVVQGLLSWCLPSILERSLKPPNRTSEVEKHGSKGVGAEVG